MVSKSKILGRPSLIFVSVGSTKFPFIRLSANIDKAINGQKNPSSRLIQQGNPNYIWQYPNVKTVDYLSPRQLISQIRKADKIIIHGGPATIFLAVKYAKFLPLVIPRLAKYKEHVNDHQLFFTQYLRKKLPNNLKKYFIIDEKTDPAIGSYLKEKNKVNNLNKFLFLDKDKNKIAIKLERYINKL